MENYTICHCKHVTYADIENALHSESKFENVEKAFDDVQKITKDTYLVTGGRIIRISQVTDSRSTEQIIRFQNIMIGMGIMDELKRQGVQNGDTIIVGKLELEYWDDEVYK